MSAQHTPGPWGIEQTRDMLWVGPMRDDGHKVDHVVVGLNIDSEMTQSAALRQLYNSRLIAAAPDLLEAACALLAAYEYEDQTEGENNACAVAHAAIAKAQGEAG